MSYHLFLAAGIIARQIAGDNQTMAGILITAAPPYIEQQESYSATGYFTFKNIINCYNGVNML
jgi:hypothetical protein